MFKLTFLTPEKKIVVEQDLDMAIVPGEKGEVQILRGHSPLITSLSTGIMKWKLAGEDQVKAAVISWGFCEVFPGGVRVLADIVDFANEIDIKESQEVIKKGELRLATESLNDQNWESVRREVARARADLQLVNGNP